MKKGSLNDNPGMFDLVKMLKDSTSSRDVSLRQIARLNCSPIKKLVFNACVEYWYEKSQSWLAGVTVPVNYVKKAAYLERINVLAGVRPSESGLETVLLIGAEILGAGDALFLDQVSAMTEEMNDISNFKRLLRGAVSQGLQQLEARHEAQQRERPRNRVTLADGAQQIQATPQQINGREVMHYVAAGFTLGATLLVLYKKPIPGLILLGLECWALSQFDVVQILDNAFGYHTQDLAPVQPMQQGSRF